MIADDHTLNMLLYLLPAAALAFMISRLAPRFVLFSVLTLAGTFCHELAHYMAGFITNARPISVNITPRRISQFQYDMGRTDFLNLRWYNAAITGLAPLIVVSIPLAFADWRVSYSDEFSWWDIPATFLLAPQFLCFWPSSTDWKLALHSWPYLILIPLAWYLLKDFDAHALANYLIELFSH
jgi:hypothetical protein